MEKEKLYSEYIEHLKAINKIAEDLDIAFLLMDNRGNFLSTTKDHVAIEGLLVMNMLRQDGIANVFLDAVMNYVAHKSEMYEVAAKMRKADNKQLAKQAVDELLKETGFKEE